MADDPIKEAQDILRGKEATPEAQLDLSKKLKEENAFKYGRQVLARARKQPLADAAFRLKLAQQHALCTYKDPDLLADERLTRALEILEEADELSETVNQETLGLAGAIYKRKWEVDAQKQNLERALAYYQRGYAEGASSDQGYTGINAAYILDLLADQERAEANKAGIISKSAKERTAEARRIRENLVAILPALPDQPDTAWLKEEWWFLVTVAEAYFGLQQYEAAQSWLQKARALPAVKDWEFASTARQLASLARLHDAGKTDFTDTPAWEVLKIFLGGDVTAVQTVFAGKLGLGLSGGGFRASLFHIGMLARLAELDMLRHVEVLSCVSGGSIIGAHYYLELRKLLQEKPDSAITQQDYIDLVVRVQRNFLAGVQRNVRMRVLANWLTNVRMMWGYSRTEKVGALYESEIFSRVKDGGEGKERWLNDLCITPLTEAGTPHDGFKPKYDNWHRRNKVPTLILNATTLNTGHNWQFTASWMGESPASIDPEVDANERLRRMYYHEAPEGHRRVRLGQAVGASSCVPGLFEPIMFKDLYPDRTVRLVDGGVHDNQGVVGLLEQDCTVLLMSDASGQMESLPDPGNASLGVLLRSNSILQARIRGAEADDLKARRRASLLRGLMFLHLKKDLDADPVDWVGTEDPYDASDEARPAALRGPLTRYGIQKEVQRLLAGLRTDLDSFTDAEAYALMTSGYRMTEYSFPRCIDGFPVIEASRDWAFLEVEPPMKHKKGSEKLKRLLAVGASIPFKIWKLSNPLRYTSYVLGAAAVIGFFWATWCWRSTAVFPFAWLGITAALALLAIGLKKLFGDRIGTTIMQATRYKETLKKIALGLLMATVGCLVAGIHLHVFDRLFKKWGKVDHIVDSE